MRTWSDSGINHDNHPHHPDKHTNLIPSSEGVCAGWRITNIRTQITNIRFLVQNRRQTALWSPIVIEFDGWKGVLSTRKGTNLTGMNFILNVYSSEKGCYVTNRIDDRSMTNLHSVKAARPAKQTEDLIDTYVQLYGCIKQCRDVFVYQPEP